MLPLLLPPSQNRSFGEDLVIILSAFISLLIVKKGSDEEETALLTPLHKTYFYPYAIRTISLWL